MKSIGKGDRVVVVARIDTYLKELEVNGEDRNITITEFTATAIGPELHYATADVARNPRNSDDDRDPGEQPEAPKRRSKPADDTEGTEDGASGEVDPEPARGRNTKSTARSRAKAPVDDDEF